MEVHRQNPVVPTRTVYTLTPPAPTCRPIKSPHTATSTYRPMKSPHTATSTCRPMKSPHTATSTYPSIKSLHMHAATPPPTTHQPIKTIHTTTPPYQSRSIETLTCTPTRKVIRCRPIDHETELTQFDVLLESYNDWLAQHPTPTHSPSLSTALYTSHSTPIGDYHLNQLTVNKSTEQEPSSYKPESSNSWQHSGFEQVSATPNTSPNQFHPKHYIIHPQNTVSSHSSRVLTPPQIQDDDTAATSILLPLKLEDLLSEIDSSRSSNENSILSPTSSTGSIQSSGYEANATLSPEGTNKFNYSLSGTTPESVSPTPLKTYPSEAAILLSDRFYHCHLLCWGVRGLVHNVLRGRRLRGVATAHHQLVRLRDGLRRWRRKTERLRLKKVQSRTMAGEFHKRKVLRRMFQAWRLHIYRCNLKQFCEAYTRQRSVTLLQACFNQWVFQAALHVGDNFLCTKLHTVWQFTLCQKTFHGWSRVTRTSRVYRTIVNLHSKRLLKSCFSRWKESYLLCHLQELHGITQLHQLKKKQIFDKWRLANENKVVIMEMSADQVHTLRRYFSLWRGFVAQKTAKLEEYNNILNIKVRKHMLAQWLNIWRRQLKPQRLVRIHRKKKLLHIAQQCFINWRDHTVSCYTDISMHFASKVQHALNIDPLTTYETMESCLITISLNLGLISEADFQQIITHSNKDTQHRPIQLLSNTMEALTHSTPVACHKFEMREYRELSQERSSVKFVSDLSKSYEVCPMSHHSETHPNSILHQSKTCPSSILHHSETRPNSILHQSKTCPSSILHHSETRPNSILHQSKTCPSSILHHSETCPNSILHHNEAHPDSTLHHNEAHPDSTLHHSETTIESIVPFQLFACDDLKSSLLPQQRSLQADLTEIDRTLTTVNSDTPSMRFCSTSHSQLCTCLNPDVAKHIRDVKQKLEDLSASLKSFKENTFPTQSHTAEHFVEMPLLSSTSDEQTNKMELEVSGELDDNRSPILSLPPGFTIENDRQVPDETHNTCFPSHDPQVQSTQYIELQVPAIVGTAVSCIRNLRLYPCNIAFYSWMSYSLKKCSSGKDNNLSI